ncbi:hypothetical protein [Streptomyces sp. NPDC002851]
MRGASAGQRRIVAGAEAVTGRLVGPEGQLAALVRRGLAFRHSRPPHDFFLTPAGHRLREELLADTPPPAAPASDAAPGVFAARTGNGTDPVPGPGREREVHSAWEGLLEMRRLTNPAGATDRPCAWEHAHLVPAAALALEAAGCRPAGAGAGAGPGAGAGAGRGGYRVAGTPQPDAVGVRWISGGAGPEGGVPASERASAPGDDAASDTDMGLDGCALALERAGWQVSRHTERGGARLLLASPRRV